MMTAEDILLLDNEVNFLVNLKRAAQRAGNKALESALSFKLSTVLPVKAAEINKAFYSAQQDYNKDNMVMAARYCGRTL